MTTRLAEYRTAGDLWRGLAAAAVLAAVVVGAPTGLLAIGGHPRRLIPDQWPQLSQIRQWPDQAWRALRWAYYDGSLFPTIMLLVVWAAWLTLAWMVLAEVIAQVRHGAAAAHRRFSTLHPRGWICGLVAAVLVLMSSSGTASTPSTGPQPVATAHHDPPHPHANAELVAAPIYLGHPVATQHTDQPTATEGVQPPADGHYDSLWRIADRRLGSGSRWPEIWHLNHGQTQVDGRVFTNPNLIHPGWVLTLPEPAPAPPAPPPADQDDDESSTTPTHGPQPTSPAPVTQTPAPPATNGPDQEPHSGTGITVGTGAFVGLGLAALITAAAFTVRLWQRRHYRPGTGERDTITDTPIVRALRIAHDKATLPHDDDGTPIQPNPAGSTPATRAVTARHRALHTAAAVLPAGTGTVVGLRDGQAQAIHIARTRGLGLVGPGATAAARALLVTHLADAHLETGGEVNVFIPAADIHALVDDPTLLDRRSARLRIVDTLDAALDLAEAELLTRTRRTLDSNDQNTRNAPLVLVATPTPHAQRRLQAILDNGSTLGFAGVLLGPWPAGTTVLVASDGSITSTTHDTTGAFAGTRLFTLPVTDTRALLDLLNAADEATDNAPNQPTNPGQHDVRRHTPVPDDVAPDSTHVTGTPDPPAAGSSVDTPSNTSTPPPGTDVAETEGHSTAPDELDAVRSPTPQHQEPIEVEGAEHTQAHQPLSLRVLGRVELVLDDDGVERKLGGVPTPKQREVLVYLALHPQGARREALNDAVWPDSRPPRQFNSLHNALSLLRRALGNATNGRITDIIDNDDGHYSLDAELISTDYERFRHALKAPRPAADGDALAPLREALELYQGDLAEDLTAPWIEPFRESIRREILDALGVLIRAHSDTDPETMLMLLERTRKLDRYNESVYRDIIRTHARLGQYDAIPRTLAMLTTALDELDQRPSADTLNLVDFLQRSGGARRPTSSGNAAAS